MSGTYVVDNEGIGSGPFITMTIDAVLDKDFSQEDIDNGFGSCMVSGDNGVGKGDCNNRLFGKVVWVSTDLVSGTTRPATCAVQIRGVARFKYNLDHPPVVDWSVVLNGDGKVKGSSPKRDNTVIAVNVKDETCDVVLG